MPVTVFLRDYWQKKPLLIRQAFADFHSPVSADELAGFALDEDVVSRLVVETPSTDGKPSQWQVSHGPFAADTFAYLPPTHWTLLVQHADQLDPSINAILDAFRFIPNWRLDDIMVSYATAGGGVGPHFDYYDVFLLQAQGERRWRLGGKCTSTTALQAETEMRILAQFTQTDDWTLAPGDMLYLPPNLAHWGTAVGESITFSIGFRAPSHAEILLDYTQELATYSVEDERYADPDLTTQDHCGEVIPTTLAKIQQILKGYLNNPHRLMHWLGERSTHRDGKPIPRLTTLKVADLNAGRHCRLNRFSKAVFFDLTQLPDSARLEPQARLFVDGQGYDCSLSLAQDLTEKCILRPNALNETDKLVLIQLCTAKLLTPAEKQG